MIEHIVKNNETINDILEAYHISLLELKDYNKHITSFDNLPYGMKLKIPYLKEEIEQILDETDVLVEKYYNDVIEEFNSDSVEDTNNESMENNTINDLDMEQEKGSSEIFEDVVTKSKDVPLKESKLVRDFKTKYNNRIAYPGIIPPKKPYKGNNFYKK